MKVPTSWRKFDAELTAKIIAAASSPIRQRFATLFAHSGDSLLWLLLGGALCTRQNIVICRVGLQILATVLFASSLSTGLKYLFRRRRPESDRHNLHLRFDQYSFPSGHAVRVAALTVALSGWLPSAAVAALLLWSLLVSVSRVALRVHFASDLVFGLLIGWLAGALLLIVF